MATLDLVKLLTFIYCLIGPIQTQQVPQNGNMVSSQLEKTKTENSFEMANIVKREITNATNEIGGLNNNNENTDPPTTPANVEYISTLMDSNTQVNMEQMMPTNDGDTSGTNNNTTHDISNETNVNTTETKASGTNNVENVKSTIGKFNPNINITTETINNVNSVSETGNAISLTSSHSTTEANAITSAILTSTFSPSHALSLFNTPAIATDNIIVSNSLLSSLLGIFAGKDSNTMSTASTEQIMPTSSSSLPILIPSLSTLTTELAVTSAKISETSFETMQSSANYMQSSDLTEIKPTTSISLNESVSPSNLSQSAVSLPTSGLNTILETTSDENTSSIQPTMVMATTSSNSLKVLSTSANIMTKSSVISNRMSDSVQTELFTAPMTTQYPSSSIPLIQPSFTFATTFTSSAGGLTNSSSTSSTLFIDNTLSSRNFSKTVELPINSTIFTPTIFHDGITIGSNTTSFMEALTDNTNKMSTGLNEQKQISATTELVTSVNTTSKATLAGTNTSGLKSDQHEMSETTHVSFETITPTASTQTVKPTFQPEIIKPTVEPETVKPTSELTTEKQTTKPVTEKLTTQPVTEKLTTQPVTEKLTTPPVTEKPTTKPETDTPTPEPETEKPEPETEKPNPEPETEKPSPEPETENPTPEPETEKPKPESEPDEPVSEFDVFAEPGPDWETAKPIWKEAWEFHIYFFGVCFVLLGIYCFICVIRLWKMDHLLSRNYFLTLNILVIVVCVLRATYLLVDAYNSNGTFPMIMDYFLYSTVFPCITAVFSILFYALLLATRVQVLSRKVQKLWVLILIISLHFGLSFVTDIIVGLFSTAAILIFICQSFFILWGLLMFIGYLVIFKRLHAGASYRKQSLRRNAQDRKSALSPGYHEKLPKQKYTLGLAVKVTLMSAFFGLAWVVFELYGMFGVYGVFRETKPEPWPWWVYHMIIRSLELAMCSSVAYVATQPLKYTHNKNKGSKLAYLFSCKLFCCYDKLDQNEETSSFSMDQCVVSSESDHIGWLKRMKNKKVSSPDAPYPPHTGEIYRDPDATLLVRKVRQPRPSMLVVEDGFVRIRGDDETAPTQFDLDCASQSSQYNTFNRESVQYNRNQVRENIVEQYETNPNQYTSYQSGGNVNPGQHYSNVDNVNPFSQYIIGSQLDLSSAEDVINGPVHNREEDVTYWPGDGREINRRGSQLHDTTVETDIDIDITDSENSDLSDAAQDSPDRTAESSQSENSGNIFRPLSMIDLAASLESEMERCFHSSYVDSCDLISHNSLPLSLEAPDSNEDIYNERLYEQYGETDPNVLAYSDGSESSDSADASGVSNTRLIKSPIRRSKSEDCKPYPKVKLFEKNKYFSVSDIEHVGKEKSITSHDSNEDVSDKVYTSI